MSYFPNCRKDENYNESKLDEKNKEFVAGYDWAVEQIKVMFDNLDVYPDLELLLEDNTAIIKEGKAKMARDCVEHWAEMMRNEMIVGMIDGQEE